MTISEWQDAVNQIDAHGKRCDCDDCAAARWTLQRMAMLGLASGSSSAAEPEPWWTFWVIANSALRDGVDEP